MPYVEFTSPLTLLTWPSTPLFIKIPLLEPLTRPYIEIPYVQF